MSLPEIVGVLFAFVAVCIFFVIAINSPQA